ncbi:MAG: MBL fold metallo-hydrolase, partial [Pseudomonadota bacterium]|nr:MBL fold metallo-hydrolase [Pseudomonadota bacterium]
LWCTTSNKAAVIDPGGDLDNILGAVEQNGVELEKILVTHAHIDHAGGVAELAERLDLPIEGPHPEDQFWIDRIEESGSKYGINARAFEPNRWLDGRDTVTIGEQTLGVRHCPGHTPGHVIFHHAPSKLAAVGDVLFQGSIGRSDFPRGDHDQLIDSIVTQLWPLGDDVTFIPGHGPLSTFGHERQHNPFVCDIALGRA